jgi:hypothetical protein
LLFAASGQGNGSEKGGQGDGFLHFSSFFGDGKFSGKFVPAQPESPGTEEQEGLELFLFSPGL